MYQCAFLFRKRYFCFCFVSIPFGVDNVSAFHSWAGVEIAHLTTPLKCYMNQRARTETLHYHVSSVSHENQSARGELLKEVIPDQDAE